MTEPVAAPAPFEHTRTVRIEWGDCDPAGIVFYPRYFAIFNECTMRLFEAAGLGLKRDMLRRFSVVGTPMVECRARFLRPLRFGDDAEIASHVARCKRSSLDVVHRLACGGEAAVECFETRVWAEADPASFGKIRSAVVPDAVRAALGLPPWAAA